MNAKADIWMPFYIGDYFADTMHLNAEQHGAYLLLLFTYWKRRRPLPNDPVFLANAARLSSDAWSIHQAVLKEFFDTSSGNAWVHHRVESELLKATDKKQKAAEKAKKAAEGRWKNASSNASSITQEMLKECPSPSPSQLSSTTTVLQPEDLPDIREDEPSKTPPVQRAGEGVQFPMHEEWEPSDHFDAMLLRAGLKFDADTKKIVIAEFISFRMKKNELRVQVDWDHLALQSAIHWKTKNQVIPLQTKQAQKSALHNFDNVDYSYGVKPDGSF